MTDSKPSIVFAGCIQSRSGYGARCRDIARSLIALGYDNLKIISLKWGSTPMTALDSNKKEDQELLSRIHTGAIDVQPDIFIHCTIPVEFQTVGKYNIGITAGIETTACRPEWIEGCNRMNLVIVSSNHSKLVFEQSTFNKVDKVTNQPVGELKLTTPVTVLFEGVDTDIYIGSHEPYHNTNITKKIDDIPEDFAFLFCGHWLQGDLGHDRKDIGMLVHTFVNVFKEFPVMNKPALILKTSSAGFSILERNLITSKIEHINQMFRDSGFKGELPKVYLLHGDLDDTQMNELYNHPKIKCMVSFTKGEGFGRPLLEFTTTGKPVVVSNWSGVTDFLDPNASFMLPGEVQNVHPSACNEWIIPEARWFTVSYNFAAQVLKNIYTDYNKYVEVAQKHIDITKNKFTTDHMTEALGKIIDDRESFLPKDTKTIRLPNLNNKKDATESKKSI